MSEYIMDRQYDIQHGMFSTVKREEIVRCRDCKHCDQREAIFPPTVCERWGYYNFKTEPDRFCAWGERKVVDE